MNQARRTTLVVMTCAFTAFSLHAAAQQDAYPNRPIRFVTGYAPGGSTSIVSRLVGQRLTESLGQQVLVDNRPGAGTMVGTNIVAKASPDGYTILLAGGSIVLVPLILKAPYDPIKDFAPIATIAATELVLVVHPSVPATSLQELIAHAKARPGQLNYATPGAGGSQHLAHELLNMLGGISTQHIPYKGSNPAMTDLMAGQVQMYFSTAVTGIGLINSKRVTAIAITGDKRFPTLPSVPTFAESGMPGMFRMGGYFGIVAPARTPRPVVEKLSGLVAQYQSQPEFRETLINNGLLSYTAGPDPYHEILKEGLQRNVAILKKLNLKFDK